MPEGADCSRHCDNQRPTELVLSEIAQLQPVAAQIRAARNQEIRVAGATTKAAICRTLDAEMMAHRMGKPVPMTAKHSVAQPIIETIKRLDPNFGPKWSRNKKRGRRPGEGTAAPELNCGHSGGLGGDRNLRV